MRLKLSELKNLKEPYTESLYLIECNGTYEKDLAKEIAEEKGIFHKCRFLTPINIKECHFYIDKRPKFLRRGKR